MTNAIFLRMRTLLITGAGVSAESGIPTFRGKDGYWRNLDPAKLATAKAFADRPKLVWEWYRQRRQWIRQAQPNPAHEAIVRLARHLNEFLLVTQNVDDLHFRAGMPHEKMVQIHGDIFETRCTGCNFVSPGSGGSAGLLGSCMLRGKSGDLNSAAPILQPDLESAEVPTCPECGEFMRPGVVWFGERLDTRQIQRVENFIAHAASDVVIVAGTTAAFGYIIDWAVRARAEKGQLLEVNPDATPLCPFATRLIREPAGVALPRLVDELLPTLRLR